MEIAIFVMVGLGLTSGIVILSYSLWASRNIECEAGRVRRGLVWHMPLRDSLAPWKNQPWARELERPEFRELHDPPPKPDDR